MMIPVGVTVEIQRHLPPASATAPAGIVTVGAQRATAGVETMPASATVEILVFSGRPNPQVVLPRTFTSQLMEDAARLAPSATAPDDGLGYRGIRVSGLPDGTSLLIASGHVTLERPNRSPIGLADQDRRIECRLLRTAIDGLPADQSGLADYLRSLLANLR